MGVKYVDEFSFPSDFGFSKSAEHGSTPGHDDGTYVAKQRKAGGGRVRRYADGGSSAGDEISTSANDGTEQTGHIDPKTGQPVWDEKVAPWRRKIHEEARAEHTRKLEPVPKPGDDGFRRGGKVRKKHFAIGGPMLADPRQHGGMDPMGGDGIVDDPGANLDAAPQMGQRVIPQARSPLPFSAQLPVQRGALSSMMPGSSMPGNPASPLGVPQLAKGGKFIGDAVKHPGRMKRLAKEHGRSVHEEMEHDKHSSSPSLRSAANLGLRLTGGDLSPRKKVR